VWRSLKTQPAEFAKYIATFKKSTYKRVIKETVSPDLISSMLEAVRDHSSGIKPTILVLEGLGEIDFFDLFLSLLPEQDISCLKTIFAALVASETTAKIRARVEELRNLYRLSK
jgi:hypothetical protein